MRCLAVVEVDRSIKVANASLTQNQCFQCVTPPNSYCTLCQKRCILGPHLTGCFQKESYGYFIATAGQRVDPRRESPFVWRAISTDTHRDEVSVMNYTNWFTGQPDYGFYANNLTESCVNLWSGRYYTWNDYNCAKAMCSVCEIDM